MRGALRHTVTKKKKIASYLIIELSLHLQASVLQLQLEQTFTNKQNICGNVVILI